MGYRDGVSALHPEVSPQQITTALAITTGLVKVISGATRQHLHPVDAIALIGRYPTGWTVKLRPDGQVKHLLREVSAGPAWQACYRTEEAAVLPPSIEWLNSRYSRLGL